MKIKTLLLLGILACLPSFSQACVSEACIKTCVPNANNSRGNCCGPKTSDCLYDSVFQDYRCLPVPPLICLEAPSMMKAARAAGACKSPFACVHIDRVQAPTPTRGQVLIRVNASSVNPSDVDTVEGGGCTKGCGADVAGVVAACPGCATLRPGDEVWTLAEPAYAEYVLAEESLTVAKPQNLAMHAAATIPEVGMTSWLSLKRTAAPPGTDIPPGSPWADGNFSNLTVLVTAGTGGTGFIGIELAKVWGAKHIATATTGDAGIAFAYSLGATYVTDYKVQDIFDSLPDNSVDIVYDNYGAEGTADKAMRTIRPGGMYLLMPHGECYEDHKQGPPCLSANPKPGVRQLNYVTGPDFRAHAKQGLGELTQLFEKKQLTAHIDKTFTLDNMAAALSYSSGPGAGGVGSHIGKIVVTM